MNLQQRIDLLNRLGEYILSGDTAWQQVKEKAGQENGWFTAEFVHSATQSVANYFLRRRALEAWAAAYDLPDQRTAPKTVGIVMAGNIPLVGFHDLLCVFISGHRALIKPSSKDTVLIRHLADTLTTWNAEVAEWIGFADRLKGCDAYIATGSHTSAGYFNYYFGRYPHIIRRNRTAVAILNGQETSTELEQLADDVFLYFGLGCRNVTKLYVPRGYDFVPLLSAFKKYDRLAEHHKYKNNYDYNLALHLLNNKFYMSTEAVLLVEDTSLFSPISQLNYEYYDGDDQPAAGLKENENVQCITGRGFVPFGHTQVPAVTDYADGVDTLDFLNRLS